MEGLDIYTVSISLDVFDGKFQLSCMIVAPLVAKVGALSHSRP